MLPAAYTLIKVLEETPCLEVYEALDAKHRWLRVERLILEQTPREGARSWLERAIATPLEGLLPIYEIGSEQELFAGYAWPRGAPWSPSSALEPGTVIERVLALARIVARLATSDGRLGHGAIRPERIWQEPSGALTLGGLGVDAALLASGCAVRFWTPEALRFVAPEVLRGEPPAPSADVYSLGALLEGARGSATGVETLMRASMDPSPGGRPTPTELIELLQRSSLPTPPAAKLSLGFAFDPAAVAAPGPSPVSAPRPATVALDHLAEPGSSVQEGWDVPDTSSPSAGTIEHVDGYDLLDVLGAGAASVVRRGIRRSDGRSVAIKILHPKSVRSAPLRRRLEREATILETLRHPNIVEALGYGATRAGAPYLVMELLEGSTLGRVILEGGPLSASSALRIALQIARGLAAAEQVGIVHRDLKPSNVLLQRRSGAEQVKILDFGLARIIDPGELTRITQAGYIGTPSYSAPEQILDPGSASAAADRYSLGAILFAMLTGRNPFVGDPQQMLRAQLSRGPDTSALGELGPLVSRLLSVNPADRFADIGELTSELERHIDRLGVEDTAPELPTGAGATLLTQRRSDGARAWATPLAAIAILVSAGALVAASAKEAPKVIAPMPMTAPPVASASSSVANDAPVAEALLDPGAQLEILAIETEPPTVEPPDRPTSPPRRRAKPPPPSPRPSLGPLLARYSLQAEDLPGAVGSGIADRWALASRTGDPDELQRTHDEIAAALSRWAPSPGLLRDRLARVLEKMSRHDIPQHRQAVLEERYFRLRSHVRGGLTPAEARQLNQQVDRLEADVSLGAEAPD